MQAGYSILKHLGGSGDLSFGRALTEWMAEDASLSAEEKLEELKDKYQSLRAELKNYSEELAAVQSGRVK